MARKPIASETRRGEFIGSLWDAWKRGVIDWASVQQGQAAVMPRCRCCRTRPMVDRASGRCEVCYAKRLGVALPSGESCMTKRGRR